jgi:type IV pilus assembly protein PilM
MVVIVICDIILLSVIWNFFMVDLSKVFGGKFNIKKLGQLISGEKGSVIGVDIGTSAIKIVQLGRHENKIVLENYGELALGPYAGVGVGQAAVLSKQKIKEALVDIFREANIEGTSAAFSIPMGATMLSLIELPKVDRKQLNAIIPMEARKYIPIPVSEVTLDWYILPPQEDTTVGGKVDEKEGEKKPEKVDVLLAAIHNETMNKYNELTSDLNLVNRDFEIDIFSAIRSATSNDSEAVLIMDMGAGTTKLAVSDFGILRMQHIINMGSQDVTIAISKVLQIDVDEAENIKRERGLLSEDERAIEAMKIPLEHIVSEVNKVIANYRKKHARPITKIVLTGGGVMLGGLVDYAKKSFSVPVEVGDPFSRIETPAFLQETLKRAGPEFAVALGLAIKVL